MIGAVLAGGSGRRFGGDKLFFELGGKPLLLHTIERLREVRSINEIVLIPSPENRERVAALGYKTVVDKLTLGPISGLYTALGLGDALVVAGDMPLLVPEFLEYLVDLFHRSGRRPCIPRWGNGYLEPLHAVYPREFREILARFISSGRYALNEAVRSAGPCYVEIEGLPEGWRKSFFNVNTREDLEKIVL